MNKGTLIFQIPKDSDFEFSTRTNLFKILKVFDLESFVMRRHCHDFVRLWKISRALRIFVYVFGHSKWTSLHFISNISHQHRRNHNLCQWKWIRFGLIQQWYLYFRMWQMTHKYRHMTRLRCDNFRVRLLNLITVIDL